MALDFGRKSLTQPLHHLSLLWCPPPSPWYESRIRVAPILQVVLIVVIWAPHSLITVLRWHLVGDAFGKLPIVGREYVLNLFAFGTVVCIPLILADAVVAVAVGDVNGGRYVMKARYVLLWLQLFLYRVTMQSKIDRRRILEVLPIGERIYENYVIPILCEVTRIVSVAVMWYMIRSDNNSFTS